MDNPFNKRSAEPVQSSQPGFDFDVSDDSKGFEDINSSTVSVPFIKVAQQLSPQLGPNKPEYIKDLKLGDLFNSISGKNYGTSVNIVIGKFERIYIEWKPNRGGFVSYHTPENALNIATDTTFGRWKHGENDLSENYVYYIMIEGAEEEGVLILSLSSTQIKKAKALNRRLTSTIMDNGQKALPYYLKWKLSSIEEHKDSHSWFGVIFEYEGYVNETQYNLIREERKTLSSDRVDFKQIDDRNQGHGQIEDF